MKKINLIALLMLFFWSFASADTEPGNNSPGTTTDILPLNGNVTGSSPQNDHDYYQLTLSQDGNLSFSISDLENNYIYMYLVDADGTTQLASASNYAQSGFSMVANGLAAGTYYVYLYNSTAGTSNYTLTNTQAVPIYTNDVEPNNSSATATLINQNDSITGHIAHRSNGGAYDNNDYYQVNLSADGAISVNLKNNNNSYQYIYIYDNDGTTQLAATSGYALNGVAVGRAGLAAGTYFIRIYSGNSDFAGYSLTTNATLTPFANNPEPNDSPAQATVMNLNSTVNGHIAFRYNGGAVDNYDYYQFTTNADGDVTLNISNNNNAYIYLYLYDNDGVTQLSSNSAYAQSGFSLTRSGLAAGTYYVAVYSTSSEFNSYTLTNTLTPVTEANDAEVNNLPSQATLFPLNSTTTGHIAYRNNGGTVDNDDYYLVHTNSDGNLTFTLSNLNNHYVYIYLYDTTGGAQLNSASAYAQSGITMTTNGLAEGYYYLRVYSTASEFCGYTLSNTLTPASTTVDNENNDTPANAVIMAPNSTVNGHIAYRRPGGSYDNYDYYKVVTSVDGSLAVNITVDPGQYVYLYLYDGNGTTQLNSQSSYNGASIVNQDLAAGTYYIVVYSTGGYYSGYTLNNTLTAAPYNNDNEPNNTFATAQVLNNSPSKSGHIAYRYNGGQYDNEDNWQINMLTTDSLHLKLELANNNYTYVYLYNSAQSQIFATSGYNLNYDLFWNNLGAGTYYLKIYASSGSYNSYRVNYFYYPCDNSASSISAGGPTTFCAGGSVSLNSNQVYNSYSWSNGATTGSINVSSSGNYTMTGYDVDGCEHVSNTISVTVNPLPAIPTISPAGPVNICEGSLTTLTSTAATSYLWSNGETTASITTGIAGFYTVTVFNAAGCSATSSAVQIITNPLFTWYADSDGDTYGNPASSLQDCTQPFGFVSNNTDCNDANAAIFPNATEACNGIDDNCNGQTDEGCGSFTYYEDSDGDTYGNPAVSVSNQNPVPPIGYVGNNSDCNDANAAINPGATETCNTIDDNCNGLTDDGLSFTTYYLDGDADSYGNAAVSVSTCNGAPLNYVSNNSDCNDANAAVNPGATEICNNIDDNCNGLIDDGISFTTYYLDSDADNYGDAAIAQSTCNGAPLNYVSNNTDCNDANASINPGATEICNAIDDNCDGTTDEGCGNYTYFADMDADGFGDPSNTTSSGSVTPPAGYVVDNTDCNDANGLIFPGASEICNAIDDNCNGLTDEGLTPSVAGPINGSAGACQGLVTGSSTYSIATVPGASSYQWTVPTGMTIISGQGTNSIFVSWNAIAVHNGVIGQICVLPVNACGNGVPSCKNIDINYTAPVTPPSISGPSKVCPGDFVTFSISNVARASQYNWTLPAGMTLNSGAGTNIITVQVDGNYSGGTMQVTASNICGSSPVRIKSMLLNTPLTPAAISGYANGVCGQSNVTYYTTGSTNANYYNWTVPAGATITNGQGSTSISVDFSNSFSGGNITVAGANNCGSGSARTLSVTGAPAQPGIITGPSSVCRNQAGVIYDVNTVTGTSNYIWTVPNGAIITAGQGTKTITVTFGGTPASGQLVSVKAANNCGTSLARIKSAISITFCTRLDNENLLAVEVYPNPAHDQLNIRYQSIADGKVNMQLMDLTGRIVINREYSVSEGQGEIMLDLNGLSKGIYMLQTQFGDQTDQTKIIVE